MPRIPRQEISSAEVDPFLEYLFSAIARRPRPLRLRKGAAVARYLKTLAWEAPPGRMRWLLDRLGDVIWGTLLQHAPFSMSRRQEALEFLEKHAATYLAAFNVEAARDYVQAAKVPTRRSGALPPPRLLSRDLAVQGSGSSRLQVDLTERIYAGCRALRRAGVHGARGRIAQALNGQELKTGARGMTDMRWGSAEVVERVKQFEARRKVDSLALRPWREAVVNKWVYLFRSRQEWVKGAQEAATSRRSLVSGKADANETTGD